MPKFPIVILLLTVPTIAALAAPTSRPTSRPSTTRPTSRPTSKPIMRPLRTEPAATSAKPSNGTKAASKDPLNYQKSTPAQDAQAVTDAQKRAADTGEEMGIKFTEMQTTHFIIFTDWDPREYNFLKNNVENAYTAVSRQFEMSPKDNIFVGKLPIYMFTKRADFYSFASKIDHFDPPKGLAGYCQSRTDGFSHMAMSKPESSLTDNNTKRAEFLWSYVLTHEFTHAFVARYRTNRNIPRWLNEGIAEVVANSAYPRSESRLIARAMADDRHQISSIFNDDQMPGFEMYPVMMTMTEALIKVDPKKFLGYFNALKDGAEPEKTMKETYGVDYAGLEAAWRKYIKTAK